MRMLLDTHTFLWFVTDSPRLSDRARAVIRHSEVDAVISTATLWEMAIKVSRNRLTFDKPFEQFIPEQLKHNDIDVLRISFEHVAEVARLPHHHGDPFDRLMIAQLIIEQIPIVGVDQAFDAYTINRIW